MTDVERDSPGPDSHELNEWQQPDHTAAYLQRADRIPHRAEGESTLLEQIPPNVRRVLDLGAGDGRLLQLVLEARPRASGVAVDFSPPMLRHLSERFAGHPGVRVIAHDLADSLPELGRFDVVISSFAIHHLTHDRKRSLYAEIWDLLDVGGVFCNLEHVASASALGHEQFLQAMGLAPGEEDPSNKLLDVETQLQWLREIGFSDVDCYWKWRELALLAGGRRIE
jgi:tRNA (cmo5U34)-methyltransferase